MSQLGTSIDGESKHVATLNQFVDIGIASILFVAPLAMAGRFAPGRLLLAILVGATAIAWCLLRVFSRRNNVAWLWTGAEWIACLSVLLVVLQLVPWSQNTLETLSPSINNLLPLHSPPDVAQAHTAGSAEETYLFGRWRFASLAPHATRGGLAMTIVYAMLFAVVSQRVRRRHDVERLMKGIALAGILMATLGLIQLLFGNGKFLGFMEHPSRDTLTAVKGTFANENHFAHFLALTLGPLLWWLVKEQGATEQSRGKHFYFGALGDRHSVSLRQMLLCIGLGIVLLTGLLTYSRGGLAVMMLAGVVTTGVFVYQRRVGKRAVIAVSSAVVIAVLAVWIHGQDILARELETLQQVSIENLDQGQGRRKIWSAVLQAVPDFAMLGSGVGSHRYLYPTYFSSESSVQYTHAESGFLHVLLETGGPGFALMLLGIGFSGYWIVSALLNSEKTNVAFLAVPLVSCWLVSVTHAIFDFNWFIPANMCMTLIVAAMGARLWGLSRGSVGETGPAISKLSWCSVTSMVAVMALFSVTHYIGPARAHPSWQEYRAWSLATNRFEAKSTGNGRQRNLGFVDGTSPETIAHMIQLLDETLEYDPHNGRAHMRMSAMCLRQFELLQARSENAMTLAQIRDAALSAGFDSHQEMSDWVTKVVGDNRVYLDRVIWHCKQGMRTTPTEGLGYLYLGEVAFLDKSLAASVYDLLHQAYSVRPHDPGVQFMYGRHRLLAGDAAAAMKLWKVAFRRGSSVRRRIISAIAFQAPPHEILDVFQPDLAGLRDLFEYYRRQGLDQQMHFIGERYAGELERQADLMAGAPAGELWYDAQGVHDALGNLEESADAAKNAVLAQPSEYRNHFACALRMRDAGRLENAVKEFRWCASRKPKDTALPKVVAEMQRQIRQSKALSENAIRSKRMSR